MEKNTKSIIGVGLLGLAAYWAYTQFTASDEQTIGGSGSFTGLGGAGETAGTGLDNLAGTSDSGIAYNINLPSVDTSPIEALISAPTVSSNGSIETPVTTKKEAVISQPASSGSSNKSGSSGVLDSLAGSLSQVFGTPAQKTNERGDYYTTAAGGGAGAITGLSLGEQALNLLSGKTASGKSVSGTLPTGASTESKPLNITSDTIKQIAQTKKEQDAAIAQTKIAAYKPVDNPLQALKDSGIVKSTYNPSSSSGSSSATPKKEAVTVKKVVSMKEASSGYAAKSSNTSTGKVIKVKR